MKKAKKSTRTLAAQSRTKPEPAKNSNLRRLPIDSLAANLVLALRHGDLLSDAEARDAAFHLTDWIDDLSKLNKLFATKAWDESEAQQTILAFVAHAPSHLTAAHRIIFGLPVSDVFKIGAVKGTGRRSRTPA